MSFLYFKQKFLSSCAVTASHFFLHPISNGVTDSERSRETRLSKQVLMTPPNPQGASRPTPYLTHTTLTWRHLPSPSLLHSISQSTSIFVPKCWGQSMIGREREKVKGSGVHRECAPVDLCWLLCFF